MIRVTEDELLDGTIGYCIRCGTSADGVEPDARQYRCDACGAFEVYGLEELLITGRVEITAEAS